MTTPQPNDHPLYEGPRHPNEIPSDPPPQRQQHRQRPPEDRPYVTYALLAINILIFLVGYVSQEMQLQIFGAGMLYPPAVVEGNQIYRLFTAMFLHADPAHILFNMYALYIVGNMIEPIFGRLRFGIIYLLGGLAGSVLSLALGSYDVPSVGASGAIFAIFAAEGVHLYQHRTVYRNVKAQLRQIVFLIGLNLFLGFIGTRIDNWGHIGGMIGGAILAWRIAPRLQQPKVAPRSMSDLARLDTNPLSRHLPELVIYCFALIGLTFLAIHMLAP